MGADDAANNAKLLGALKAVPLQSRSARYRCVLVFVAGAADPAPLDVEGVWEGFIVDSPRGSAGFGYDPHFWLPELKMTAAELEPVEKNRRSHRGTALRLLRQRLEART
jgi:XTP/dITP diphosphohydrolase